MIEDGHAVAFLVVWAAMVTGHWVGDHWIQTQYQAVEKGGDGWRARIACVSHVTTYTLTQVVLVTAVVLALHVPIHFGWTVAGLGVSAVTHYVADRREPLRRIARLFGSGPYLAFATVVRKLDAEEHDATGPGTALFHMDQTWHLAWCFVASLVMAAA